MTSWTLPTATGSYAVSTAFGGTALVLDYFGPAADPVPRWQPSPHRVSMAVPADLAPLEYAVAGIRHVHRSELIIERSDGSRGAALHYREHRLDGAHLTVVFADSSVELALHTRTRPDSDVVERWAVLHDLRSSGDPLRLPRVLSGALCVAAPYGARVHVLTGAWGRETTPMHSDLRAGVLQLGSRQGITGHLAAPTVCVQPLGPDGMPEPAAFGAALAWSGSWSLAAEMHPNGLLRLSGGIDDEQTVVLLNPGESFETPHLLLGQHPDGPDALARVWHEHQRRVLSRSTDARHRPVLYNSWYATGFDLNVDQQLGLAKTAASLGIEAFVVDDGWFAGRTVDTAGLGDWRPDPAIFPDGLRPLAEQVRALGMRFGLWVEPEAVNPNSDLYRAHPDWIYRTEAQPLTTIRNQYVLDLGRPEVEAWVTDMLREVVTQNTVEYLKWDMNRPITAGGRPGELTALQWSVDHVRAYYRLLRMLRAEFPDLVVEACAGGGGRVDNAVIGLTDVVWPSDETGPRDRLAIQDGFLRAYPPHIMSSWVTDEPGTQDRTPASLTFRFVVAMSGVLGIGADISHWDEQQRATARAMVQLFVELRPVIHHGAVHRHGDPQLPGYAVEYAGGADQGGRIVVLVVDTSRSRVAGSGAGVVTSVDRITPPIRIRPAGVDPNRRYRVRGDTTVYSGAALRSAGYPVRWALADDADVLVFDPIL